MITETDPGSSGLMLAEQSEDPPKSLSCFLRDLLFRVLYRHQTSIKRSKAKGSLKLYLQLAFIVVSGVQMLSVQAEYLRNVKEYESYRYFIGISQGFRPDLWVINAGQSSAGLVASLCVFLLVLAGYILEVVTISASFDYSLARIVTFLIDFPILVIQQYGFLPISLFCLHSVHSSLYSATAPLYQGVLALSCLLLCYTFTLIRVLFVYDSTWALRSTRLLAHVNHTYELKEFTALAAFSLISVLQPSPMLALLLSSALALYLFVFLLVFLPYYHATTLLLKLLQTAIVAWAGVAGFIGLWTDSMTVAVKLVLFVSPLMCLLISHLVRWRRGKVQFRREKMPFWQYELAIRRLFETYRAEEVSAEELMAALAFGGKVYSEKHKEYYLLLAQYYYYIREEPEIALLRLTSSANCPGSLAIEFQISHFSQAICRLSSSEERDFVDYQRLYQRASVLDCRLCEAAYDLLNVLINKNTNEKLLERAFLNLAKGIQVAQWAYRRLKSKFPNDPFVLQSYGTFLGDLFHEPVAQELITRGFFELNRRKKTHINTIESYSSVDTGVLIVSCHHQFFGKVTFANEQLGKIIGCKLSEIVGKDLDDFIPPPYNDRHNRKLYSFLARGEAAEVFRSHLFLSSNQRFSVEVTFRFRPTVVQGVPYFVVAVRPKPNTREFAIFDSTTLLITSHSLYFPGSVHVQDRKTVVGESLSSLLPGVETYMSETHSYRGFIYRHPVHNLSIGMKFASVALGSGVIHWLYIITSEKGIDDLFTNKGDDDITRFRRSMRSSNISSEEKTALEPENTDLPEKFASYHEIKTPPREGTLTQTNKDEATATSQNTSFAKSSAGQSLRRQAHRAVRSLQTAYLVLILLITLLLAVALAVLYVTLDRNSQATDWVDLGMGRLHLVRSGHLARRINLVEAGYEPEGLKEQLQTRLWSEIASLNAVADDYLKREVTSATIHTLIKGQYLLSSLPLITALTDFSTHTQFQADQPSSDPFSTDFFYTYYNSMGPLLNVLNSTVDRYLDAKAADGVSVIAVTSGTAFLLMAVVLLASNVCIVRCLYQLMHIYAQLWSRLVTIPSIRLREIMNIHKDRIELVHGTEYIPAEQSRLRENKSILHPPNRRIAIIAKVGLFAVGSAAFLLFLLFYGYGKIEVLLRTNEDYMNAISYMTLYPTMAVHVLKEAYLARISTNSYFHIVAEGQNYPSLELKLREIVGNMEKLEYVILRNMGDIEASESSNLFSDINLPYYDACSYLNNTVNCQSTVLAKGQHPSITELRLVLSDLEKRLSKGLVPWATLQELEILADQLTEATLILLKNTQSYAAASSHKFASDMLTYASVYIGCSGLLYLFLYMPTIRSLRQQCTSLWRISTLVRSDFIPH